MGSYWSSRIDELDIELANRTALHAWTKTIAEMTHELAEAIDAGAHDLKKRLRKTPVLGHDGMGLLGPVGRMTAAKMVTSGYLRAAQEIRAVPPLVGKSFYTFDGLYVPGDTLKELGGGIDATT
jgi:hypothetical protein